MQDNFSAPPFRSGARYRTVAEPRLIDMLLVYGWVHAMFADGGDAARAEASSYLDKWVAGGLPSEIREGKRCFDPAEVVNFVTWAGLHGIDSCLMGRFVPNGRRLVCEHHGANMAQGTAPDPAALPPARFRSTLTRTFNLAGFDPGTRVRLRMPLPLEGRGHEPVDVSYSAARGIAADFSSAPGRLDIRLEVPRERVAHIELQIAFSARPAVHRSSAELSADERELYLSPQEGSIRVTPRIRKLADALAANAIAPSAVVRSFWDFLLERLSLGIVHYDALDSRAPLDSVLDSAWFDCHLGSALLVALCRARGIPARIVGGYLLSPTHPFHHYWAEAWIDGGWFPMDIIASGLWARSSAAGWRDGFFGKLDYRLTTQSFPRFFDSSPSIRLPERWHLLSRATSAGVETGHYSADSGDLIYSDRVSAVRLPAPAEAGRSVNASPL